MLEADLRPPDHPTPTPQELTNKSLCRFAAPFPPELSRFHNRCSQVDGPCRTVKLQISQRVSEVRDYFVQDHRPFSGVVGVVVGWTGRAARKSQGGQRLTERGRGHPVHVLIFSSISAMDALITRVMTTLDISNSYPKSNNMRKATSRDSHVGSRTNAPLCSRPFPALCPN